MSSVVTVYPAIGQSVPFPTQYDPPLSTDGGTATRTDYITSQIRAGRLLTWNPLADDGVPSQSYPTATFLTTQLSTYIGTGDGQVQVTSGHSVRGTNGGHFVWNANSTAAEDGGFTFGTAASGRWERQATTVSPDHFGADSSGANGSETANDAALKAMRDYLRGLGVDRVKIDFGSGGTYRYTTNKWLAGLRDIHVDLNGSTLVYAYAAASLSGETAGMVAVPDIMTAFNDVADYQNTAGGSEYLAGYKINTVAPGTHTVQLQTVGDAATFSAKIAAFGAIPVLIASYDKQPNGWPPNFQFFEFNYVEAANTGTGALTLRNYTKNDYNQNHPDRAVSTTAVGAARVFLLDYRTSSKTFANVPRSVVFRNGTIKATRANITFGIPAYEHSLFEDLRIESVAFYGFMTNNGTLRNSRLIVPSANVLNYNIEIDKIITNWTIDGCSAPFVGGGTGCKNLTIRESKIDRLTNLQADAMLIQNVEVGPWFSGQSSIPVIADGNVRLSNLTVHAANNGDAFFQNTDFVGNGTYAIDSISGDATTIIGNPTLQLFGYLLKTDGTYVGKIDQITSGTPNSYTVRWQGYGKTATNVAAGVVTFPNPEDALGFIVGGTINAWSPAGALRSGGGVITAVDTAGGTITYTGTITSIGTTDYVAVVPVAGDSLYYMRRYRYIADVLNVTPTGWAGAMPDPYTGLVTFSGPAPNANGGTNFVNLLTLPTRVQTIAVNVIKPGAGTFLFRTFGGATTIFSVDLSKAGTRTITALAATGTTGADSVTNIGLLSSLQARPRLDFGAGVLSATKSNWPQFTVTIQCAPLPF